MNKTSVSLLREAVDSMDLSYQGLCEQLAQEQKRRAELEKEVERLKQFHVEDMRVTNESADFHMKECATLRAQLTASEAQVAGLQNALKTIRQHPLCFGELYTIAFKSGESESSATLEKLRSIAEALRHIEAHGHLGIHSCGCPIELHNALQTARELGITRGQG